MAKVAEQPPKWPARPPLTGVRLDRELIRPMKHWCVDHDLTMTEYINELIRTDLRRKGYLKDTEQK